MGVSVLFSKAFLYFIPIFTEVKGMDPWDPRETDLLFSFPFSILKPLSPIKRTRQYKKYYQ